MVQRPLSCHLNLVLHIQGHINNSHMCRVINRSSFFSPIIKSFFIKLICPHRHFKVVPPLTLSFNAGGSNPLRVQRKTLYSSRAQHPCPLVLAALCIKAEGNFRLHVGVGCANTNWTSGIFVPCATTRPGSMAQFHYNQIRNDCQRQL